METKSLSPYSHGSATGPFSKPGEPCLHPTPFSQLSQVTGQHHNLQMKSAQAVRYLRSIRKMSVSNLAPGTNYSDVSRGYPLFTQPNDGRVP
jgi:hypothetical protein